MKFVAAVGLLSLLVCPVLSLAVYGARWVGQVRAVEAFPLPDAGGCWQGVCFFSMDMPTLEPLPDAAGVPNHFKFEYAPGDARPIAVVLDWSAGSYYLTRDRQAAGMLPLMRLGDVIAAIGPPDRVSWIDDQFWLHYPARGLVVFANPARLGMLRANTAVIGLWVANRRLTDPAATIYYPPSSEWHGFGLYRFEE